MNATLDRIDARLADLRKWTEEGKPLPFIDEGHDFVVGPPMDEAELQAIEREYEVRLPPEYRGFLARFGDTSVGPCHFRRVREGLSKRSKNRFPLEKPLLGTLSLEHQRLPKELQWHDYGRLFKRREPISKEDGVLAIRPPRPERANATFATAQKFATGWTRGLGRVRRILHVPCLSQRGGQE
jgi:hypothetical protein